MYGAQTNMPLMFLCLLFENDVEMYGAQTHSPSPYIWGRLRMMQKCMVLKLSVDDINYLLCLRMMQKCMVLKRWLMVFTLMSQFENDVEMYGAQTIIYINVYVIWFENDVEMYGAQTS